METNFDVTVTVTLSPDDIKKAVVAYVLGELHGKYTGDVDDVGINIQTKTVGFGIGEHDEDYLKNITVIVKPQNANTIDDDRR